MREPMQVNERQMILNYLEMDDQEDIPLSDIVYALIERANDTAMEYEVLASAYENGVPVESFDAFREEVVTSFAKLDDGQEIAEELLETIASRYTTV